MIVLFPLWVPIAFNSTQAGLAKDSKSIHPGSQVIEFGPIPLGEPDVGSDHPVFGVAADLFCFLHTLVS